ncbi:hypothetical protein PVAP13_7KG285500 [Panicum virgatum]|uniref:NAC domain-containing protein n=1 Tax=Panicum virgatum TaxID=38727 RepID=A0A8T0QLQ5_PANVG|nr:hypothetical protein PVAP13_7KG285500 [Panicum virgatum]
MAGVAERPSGGGDDEEGNYPVGFRFKPTLRELVEFYLHPKLLDKPTVPNDAVIEADAYECHPEILTSKHHPTWYQKRGADDNWYFLSPRSRRYPGGDRPTRRTADNRGRLKPGRKKGAADHSKASKGRPRKNLSVGAIEFTENTLAYYVGEPRNENETKTKWLMHELTVPELDKEKGPENAAGEKPRELNKYVMCRIYKSPLKKWRELEDDKGSTSSASAPAPAPACDEPAPTSSRSGPQPETVRGDAGDVEQERGQEARGGAAERARRQRAEQAGFKFSKMGVCRPPNGRQGACRPSRLPPLMQWPPPPMYNSMQGPVQLQRPPLTYGPHGQAPPVLRLCPPHRTASAVPNSLGRTVMMRPPNLAASQTVRPPPFPFPRPPPGQQLQMEDMKACQERVYWELLAELKSQRGSAPTASTQPACFDEGANLNHPAGAEAMVPRTQFPAPHNFYPCSGVQQQQQQSSSPAIPAAIVPPGAAGPVDVEATPAADDAPGKLSVPGDANQGSAKGDCYGYSNQLFEDLLADLAPLKN